MNRDRMTRSRMMTTGQTTIGLPERVERALIYPLFLGLVLLPFISWGWLIALVLGLVVFFVEKNRNVRWHAMQAIWTLGPLSILLVVVNLIKSLLGVIPLLGWVTAVGLGILASVIWWVMIILAVYLMIMAWFRPAYRLPFVGDLIARWV
jgi:uncharacterized membrane protein